jgi:hypothetical protein
MKLIVTIRTPDGAKHPVQQDAGSLAIAIEELTDTWFQAGTYVTIENSTTTDFDRNLVQQHLDGEA